MDSGNKRSEFHDATSDDSAAATTMAASAQGGFSPMYGMCDDVPRFSGRDKTYTISQWVEDIEDNAEIYQWTPVQTLTIARRLLTGTAALFVKSERVCKTWEDLKNALIKEFPDKLDSKTVHEMMAARRKYKTESCMDYLLIMKEMGKRGKIPDYVTIKYIIDGIPDIETNKMLLYSCSTYTDLKEKLKIYEKIKDKMSQEKVHKNMHKVNERREHKLIICYSCGERNHKSSGCPNRAKGLKCFRCNTFGHKSTECTSTPAKVTSSHEKRATVNICEVKTPVSDGHDRDNNICMTATELKNSNKNQVLKTIHINGILIDAVCDTGAEPCLITEAAAAYLQITQFQDTNSVFSGLGGKRVQARSKCCVKLSVDGHDYDNVTFYLVPNESLPCLLILGCEFLKLITLIVSKGSVQIIPYCSWLGKLNCLVCSNEFVLGEVQNETKEQVLECVENYNPIQQKEAPIQLKIVLKDDIPVAQRARRLSLAEQKIVEDQVSEWLHDGIIRVSFSEYSSPLVLVKKKDGSTRVCVDYRQINRKMVKDEYPLPIIDDLIDRLRFAKIYSVLDLKNGFFHLKVSEESIKYTAFVTQQGQYEFLKAPFGLSICPKYFMRFVTIIFQELITKGWIVIFFDDLLIPAPDEYQALERLKAVLDVASQYGLQINWKKAKLMQKQVEYLGHIIENGKVQPSKEKTDAVARYPEPKTLKAVHSFIGLASYFRKYIKDFALKAKPLTDLLKKDVAFYFNEEHRQSFNLLKEELISSPVLNIFNPKMDTELHTDASSMAYSAILLQKDYKNELHPIHYFSRKTTDAEKKYISYELEALAIIEGVKKFKHYLYGRHFKIVTDCEAFQKTINKKDLTTRVARWILLLEEYDYVIEHRAGSRMRHTDALSRHPFVGHIEVDLHEQVRRAQLSDDGLRAIIEVLKTNCYEDYSFNIGLLYKGNEKCLVIPKCLEQEILKRIHEKGHFGKRKMMNMIEKDYFIKNLSKKIDEFLLTCIPCLLATKKEGKEEGFLNCIEKEAIPLHTLHIDHIGPLAETKKLYNYILTVVDGFTKFTWLFPVKSTTTKETLDKLRIHQEVFGNPTRCITDRATAFTSNDFKQFCQEENIEHVMITTGVPRGNGQVERIHRIIIQVLTKLCIADPCQWYKHTNRVQKALNSTYQRSVDTTPFQLMMGVKMKNKEDLEIYELLQKEERNYFMQGREELRGKAKQQILKVQEENYKTFNRKRKESHKYKVGDLVAIKRTQFGTGLKLKPKYLGPYRITKIKGNDRYDVMKMDPMTEGSWQTSTSADHMKIWPENVE